MKLFKIIGNSIRFLILILEIFVNKLLVGMVFLLDVIIVSVNNMLLVIINGNICEVLNKRWFFMVLRSFLKLLLLLVV